MTTVTHEQQAREFATGLLAVTEQLHPSEGFYVGGIVAEPEVGRETHRSRPR